MAIPIYRLTIKSNVPNESEFRNVLHFSTGVEMAADKGDVATAAATIGGMIANAVVNGVSIYGWDCHYLDANNRWQPYAHGALNSTGQRAGVRLPNQTCAVVLGKTALARTIGKKFFGPISASDQSAGQIIQALKTILEVFCTFWQSEYVGNGPGWKWGTFSTVHGFVQITESLCDTLLGSQRRRKPGVGI